MRKLMTTGVLGSLLAGAVVWFVLFVIIGVTLWVSFVVGAAVAIAGMLLAAPLMGAGKSHGSGSASRGRHGPAGAQ
jgi:hypothetical protein